MDDCCHTCHTLEANEVLEKGKNSDCRPGLWPNKEQTKCKLIWPDKSKIPNYDGSSPPVVTVDLLCTLFMIIIAVYAGFLFINKDHVAVSRTGLARIIYIKIIAFFCRYSLLSLHIRGSLSLPTFWNHLPQLTTHWGNLYVDPVPDWP